MFTSEALHHAAHTFFEIFGELLVLFAVIGFFVIMLQILVSPRRIRRALSSRRPAVSAALGALLGVATPFCSCSTIPVLIGLLKSGAPFCGCMSFLIVSPILNPAVVTMMAAFFSPVAAALYAAVTFAFAVGVGLALDKAGFASCVNHIAWEGRLSAGVQWRELGDTFWSRLLEACKIALYETWQMFRAVFVWLLISAAIGVFVHEFVPQSLLDYLSSASSIWTIPLAALAGIPLHIHADTLIPIASALISRGVSSGVVVALILGGAGASVPEVSLLSSIFRPRLLIAFLASVLSVAVVTGWLFNALL